MLLVYTAIFKRKVQEPLDCSTAVGHINTGGVDSTVRSTS